MSNMDRKTANYLICPGDACPLRMTCQRWQNWLNNEDEDADEMIPNYDHERCLQYKRIEFYGG